jgi:small neutral amino acid transporter SnatA (MarC family)
VDWDTFRDLLKSTISLFVVLNPIGTFSSFAITEKMEKEDRKQFQRLS